MNCLVKAVEAVDSPESPLEEAILTLPFNEDSRRRIQCFACKQRLVRGDSSRQKEVHMLTMKEWPKELTDVSGVYQHSPIRVGRGKQGVGCGVVRTAGAASVPDFGGLGEALLGPDKLRWLRDPRLLPRTLHCASVQCPYRIASAPPFENPELDANITPLTDQLHCLGN